MRLHCDQPHLHQIMLKIHRQQHKPLCHHENRDQDDDDKNDNHDSDDNGDSDDNYDNHDIHDNAQVLRGFQPEEGFSRAGWKVASYLLC